jgi:hypothetical protein
VSTPAFGPWRPELSPAERVAAFRELRALCLAHLGGTHEILPLLRRAECSSAAAEAAAMAFDRIPPLPQRRIVASLLELSRSARSEP